MDDQHVEDDQSRRTQRTRRRFLIAAAGAGATAGAGLLGWWGVSQMREDPPGPDGPSATPVRPCLAERELPGGFPVQLQQREQIALDSEALGTPFMSVTLQDIALVPGDDADHLLITQHGASAQIQFVAVGGSQEPIVHDVEFGVNPGVAVSEGGTCWFVTREEGRVLSIGPDHRDLTDLGRVSEEATSLYSPVVGSGGTVFGGSYPTGALWSADPGSGSVTLGPRIGDNQYVRSLAVVGDRVFAGTGGSEPMLIEVDPEGLDAAQEFEVPGVRDGGSVSRLVTLPGGSLLVYRDEEDGGTEGILFDPSSGEFGEELVPGASSRSLAVTSQSEEVVYVAGERVMRWSPTDGAPEEIGRSEVENPAAVLALGDDTVIAVSAAADGSAAVAVAQLMPQGGTHSLSIAPTAHDITAVFPMPSTGHLAIGGYQGDGLVILDPASGESARTPRGTGVQQVEGGVESGEGSALVGSYGQGRVHELRLEQNDDVLESVQVDDLGEDFEQSRPIAWAQLESGFAVGTVPEQGRQGGLVQVFERDGDDLVAGAVVTDPGQGQSVVGIVQAAEDEVVISTSVRGGYGAESESDEAKVMRIVLSTGEALWSTSVPVTDAYTPIVQRDLVFCATTSGVLILELDSGELVAHSEFGEPAADAGYTAARIEAWEVQGRFLHSARGALTIVDLVDGAATRGSSGVGSPLAVLGESVYAASGADLVRITIPRSDDAPDCS